MPTRWCPTPEQIMILEEMYKGGLRTPNASQIQNITAHLSNYGIIEGKNVFYWFQNHKARDRQKLRRKLSNQLIMFTCPNNHVLKNNNNSFNAYCSNQASFFAHKSSSEYLTKGGAEGACTPQMTNCMRKLDASHPYKQRTNIMAESKGDDWMMMMMLRGACGIDHRCSCDDYKPLKTLQLFPIKGIKEEDQPRCTAIFNQENVSTSSMTLEMNSFL